MKTVLFFVLLSCSSAWVQAQRLEGYEMWRFRAEIPTFSLVDSQRFVIRHLDNWYLGPDPLDSSTSEQDRLLIEPLFAPLADYHGRLTTAWFGGDSLEHRFLILNASNTFGGMELISCWSYLSGSPNVQFDCATVIGESDLAFSMEWVANAVGMPDGSIVLHLQNVYGDEHQYDGGHRFYRATDACTYEEIFSSDWYDQENKRVYYNAELATGGPRTIVRVTEFLSDDSTAVSFDDEGTQKIDSAKCEVIDLWDMVQAFLAKKASNSH